MRVYKPKRNYLSFAHHLYTQAVFRHEQHVDDNNIDKRLSQSDNYLHVDDNDKTLSFDKVTSIIRCLLETKICLHERCESIQLIPH